MMKPEPNEVTCRGWPELGPMKFLNRSSSGEPGGNWGMAVLGGAFRVWLVEIFTTVGSILPARSAKESGAGLAHAGDVRAGGVSASKAMAHRDFRTRISGLVREE